MAADVKSVKRRAGIGWLRRSRQEAESVWPDAERWVGLALVVNPDHESTSVGVVRCVIAPVASHGRLAVSGRAERNQLID